MKSASKVLVFAACFWLIRFFGFAPLTAAIFLFIVFIFVYSRQLEKQLFFKSHLVFWLSAYFVGQSEFILRPDVFIVFSVFLIILAYWLFGLGDLIFKNRGQIYRNLNTSLFFLVSVLFFASDKSHYFFIKYFLASTAVFLLFFEVFSALRKEFPKREKIAALALGLATVEFLWAISLLPLSFLSAAALLTLLVFLGRDTIDYYFQGRLSRTFLLSQGTIFIVLLVLILGTARWTL